MTLSATLFVLAAPGARAASPLLSGYGGPGQGAQVILGGGLINPPGGGGSPPGATPASELTASAAETPSAGRSGSAKPSARHSAAAAKGSTAARASATQPSLAPAATELTAASGDTLGLSGGDALLALLALVALAVTCVLTRQLTRGTP